MGRSSLTTYQINDGVTGKSGLVGLTHNRGTLGRAIRIGQRMRFPRAYCYWNHAFVCIDDDNLIEMGGHGAQQRPLVDYADTEHVLVQPSVSLDLDFARWALKNHEQYGYSIIASLVVSMLTGAAVEFGMKSRMICSGLVAACATGIDEWMVDPSHITPAEIALKWWTPLADGAFV
jgi:hypothetical protein